MRGIETTKITKVAGDTKFSLVQNVFRVLRDRRVIRGLTVVLALLVVQSGAGAQTASPLDLKAAGDAGVKLPRLRSLLVSWRGDLVLERYYNGASVTRLANIKSASKSVISTLVGIA